MRLKSVPSSNPADGHVAQFSVSQLTQLRALFRAIVAMSDHVDDINGLAKSGIVIANETINDIQTGGAA